MSFANSHNETYPKPPIRSWFTLSSVAPDAPMPYEWEVQWIDVPLPLRYDRPVEAPEPGRGIPHGANELVTFEDSARVLIEDAIRAYRMFDRSELVDWLVEYQKTNPDQTEIIFGGKPQAGFIPHRLMCLTMPELLHFDESST